MLALVFGTLADKPQYQSRVTIIVYRVSNSAGKTHAIGMHWISYSGQLKPHLKDHLFNETSVGYKVLNQQLGSPYFTTKEIAQKEGAGARRRPLLSAFHYVPVERQRDSGPGLARGTEGGRQLRRGRAEFVLFRRDASNQRSTQPLAPVASGCCHGASAASILSTHWTGACASYSALHAFQFARKSSESRRWNAGHRDRVTNQQDRFITCSGFTSVFPQSFVSFRQGRPSAVLASSSGVARRWA